MKGYSRVKTMHDKPPNIKQQNLPGWRRYCFASAMNDELQIWNIGQGLGYETGFWQWEGIWDGIWNICMGRDGNSYELEDDFVNANSNKVSYFCYVVRK